MNESIRIRGGKTLSGEVKISSSKNATVAILPAVVLASEVVKIYDVPNIEDINALKTILEKLNIKITQNSDCFTIDPTDIKNVVLDGEEVRKLRASYYFMGALLGRFKHVRMLYPGGCNLGPRPIDLHLKGFEQLGARVTTENNMIEINAEKLVGDEIYLDIASVGATINIMLAAVFAEGKTIIRNAAKEPEIIDLSSMLNKMGAQIRGAGTNDIIIYGVNRLKGCIHDVIPDRIEAGTFICMAAAVGNDVIVRNVIPQHVEALLSKLEEMGVDMEVGVDYVRLSKPNKLKAIDIQTQTFPGFATDLQQPITPLLCVAEGTSKVTETIYPERFKHCEQLNKMGAKIEVGEAKSTVYGPISSLKGCEVTATDLRCGAGLIIAGLMADGETIIKDAYHIYRGYDNIIEKLKSLGADCE